jgi:hypothetical protein
MKLPERVTAFGASLTLLLLAGCASSGEISGGHEQQLIQESRFREHRWAGDYYQGDGLGVNVSLSLTPEGMFDFEWRGCLGVYGENQGRAVFTDGHLRLLFDKQQKEDGFGSLASEFIPIKWGERTYLIPTNEVVDFCNSVNDGTEPRTRHYGEHLLRRGEERRPAPGKPDVPLKFRPYLLERPISTKIKKVGESQATRWGHETTVTLASGRNQGLLPGMKLWILSPVFESVTIKSVEDEEAIGIISEFETNPKGPRVGWKVSSSWRRR